MDEPFGLVAKFDMDVAYCESKHTFDVVNDLVETPLEGSCDVYVHEGSSSLGFNYASPNPFDHSHVSPMCHLLHSPSIILKYLV